MISQYNLNQPGIRLESDLAGEFPLYLYWPNDKSQLLYSKSITELLNDARVPKPLNVSNEGLSFLLQSGVVPPPKTAYEGIYILGIGDKAQVSTVNGKIDIEFSHEFPFMNANRLQAFEMQPDEDLILQMLAEATISRIDESKPSFLFHSAGKDSNSIALALAEAGCQDKVTLITHKSKGQADESEISAKIAKQLGFKHQILHEADYLQSEHKQAIEDYFINAPFPCTDNVTLAYPLYAQQLPKLQGSNIIDGMGNDVFIGHVASQTEFKRQKLSNFLKHSRFLTKNLPSGSLFQAIGRTRSEWTGLSGLSYSDTKKILPLATDVSSYWSAQDTNSDYLDFRASIRGKIIDQEIFTRKARNFADSINSNIVLPWANPQVAEYFAQMPEEHLFDRKQFKNKLILRTMLNKRIGLDSDALGKMAFEYDFKTLVKLNYPVILKEIKKCKLWEKQSTETLISQFNEKAINDSWTGKMSAIYMIRIFIISKWLNSCQYIN